MVFSIAGSVVVINADSPTSFAPVRFAAATDQEVIAALDLTMRMEGIIPALESAHALGYCLKHPEELGELTVINVSGRGDKDLSTVMEYENL